MATQLANVSFLVTTQLEQLPTGKIVMVDGTVPGYTPKSEDEHYDHHHPGGAPVQIEEMPPVIQGMPPSANEVTIVTTMVDADACVAAAWWILGVKGISVSQDAYDRLRAIAWDCDHLVVHPSLKEYEDFAAKAVAGLKARGDQLKVEMGLPDERKSWTPEQRTAYASRAFEEGTIALVDAVEKGSPWPGEQGEADAYWEKQNALQPQVFANCLLDGDVAIFDQRSIGGYVDPRLFKRWIASCPTPVKFSLTVRDGSQMPNQPKGWDREVFSYTLASETDFDLTSLFPLLQDLEETNRRMFGVSPCITQWGGRAKVGGSSWNDAMITAPQPIAALLHGVGNG